MEDTKYNGWSNRSTWLVAVHLDNTSLEIHEKFQAIAVEADTKRQFENRIKILLLDTQIEKEEGYDIRQVNFEELWDSNRITK